MHACVCVYAGGDEAVWLVGYASLLKRTLSWQRLPPPKLPPKDPALFPPTRSYLKARTQRILPYPVLSC